MTFWPSDIRKAVGHITRRLDMLDPEGRFVYFIRDGDYVKIGIADDPWDRLASLQGGNPRPLSIVACFAGGRQAEMLLHREFVDHRVRGEWFRLDAPGMPELIQHFAGAPHEFDLSDCCNGYLLRARCVICGNRAVSISDA